MGTNLKRIRVEKKSCEVARSMLSTKDDAHIEELSRMEQECCEHRKRVAEAECKTALERDSIALRVAERSLSQARLALERTHCNKWRKQKKKCKKVRKWVMIQESARLELLVSKNIDRAAKAPPRTERTEKVGILDKIHKIHKDLQKWVMYQSKEIPWVRMKLGATKIKRKTMVEVCNKLEKIRKTSYQKGQTVWGKIRGENYEYGVIVGMHAPSDANDTEFRYFIRNLQSPSHQNSLEESHFVPVDIKVKPNYHTGRKKLKKNNLFKGTIIKHKFTDHQDPKKIELAVKWERVNRKSTEKPPEMMVIKALKFVGHDPQKCPECSEVMKTPICQGCDPTKFRKSAYSDTTTAEIIL